MSQSSPHCRNQPTAAPARHISLLQIYEFSAKQPSHHQPPRATARSDCHGSAPHELARDQKGDAVCAYICKPDEIVGKHYWIWYDFKTAQPRCEPTPPPADRYIPEAFKRQMTASQSAFVNNSQRAGITLSSPSFVGAPIQDEGFAHGSALTDDFKLWLSRHPGLTIEEALHRYREEQKTKQRRNRPKF